MTDRMNLLLKQLGEEIAKDPSVAEYRKAREVYMGNPELMQKINEFNGIQNTIEQEAHKEKPDMLSIETMTKKADELKKQIYENDIYLALEEAEKEIDGLLSAFNGQIMESITGEKQHSCGGCGGDCGHCH